MKLKILTEGLKADAVDTAYERIEELFNKFAEACHVVKVEVADTGEMVTYHVFYQDKPWRD